MKAPSGKWVFLLVIVLLVVGLVPFGASTAQEPTTLRLGTTYIMDTVNPLNGFYGYGIRPLWHDTLIQWAGGDRFEPGLAESWSVSDDGLVWTFKIREGVTFSDGSPLTAEEAAWSINWIIENEAPSVISYMSGIESVEALDPTTLQVTVAEPVSDMISSKFVFTWILPRQVWEGMSGDEMLEYNEVDAALGSGPYKLVEFQEGEYLIVEANENYWGGKPPVDRIIYQEFATEDALVEALLAGEIDVIGTVPASGADPLLNVDGISVSIANDFRLEELIINSSPDGTQPASLNDPAVRLAMAHAVDKEQIAIIGYLGYATPATTFLPPASGDFFNSDIVDIPYDLDAARQVLDEAGYVDSDGDGIREYSDGTPLNYRLYASDSDAYYARILEIISADFADIGIGTEIQIMSDDSLVELQVDYDNDLIYWGWNFDADPSFAVSIFTCAETEDYGWSDSGYCDPAYDELYAAQSTAVDHDARKAILWEAQEKIFNDRPYIPAVYPQTISAYLSNSFTFPDNLAELPLRWVLFNGFSIN